MGREEATAVEGEDEEEEDLAAEGASEEEAEEEYPGVDQLEVVLVCASSLWKERVIRLRVANIAMQLRE